MKTKEIKIITYGTFDLFHIGHLNLLKRAKNLGDKLIVGVSTDEFTKQKGKKVFIPFEERKEIIAAIKYVDEVIDEYSWDQKIEDIKKYEIDILVMGDDWKNKFDYLKKFVKVVYLKRTENISSSIIKRKIIKSNLRKK